MAKLDMLTTFVITLTPQELRLVNRALRGELREPDRQAAQEVSNTIMLQRAKIAEQLHEQNKKFLDLYGDA
jgi:hypothetical protein